MPIKVDDFLGERATFPRFGKLKKGGVKTANGFGQDLQWFRFDGPPDKAAIITALYGDKPNNIRVFLPHPHWRENFEVVYERHGATGLQWRGDGEFLVGWRTKEGQWVRAGAQKKKQPDDPQAVMIGRLSFIIPELGLGYVVLETKSKHDILEIAANLRSYEALRGDGGLTGIPFLLCRSPRKITVPNDRAKTGTSQVIKWLVHLEIENSWVQAKLGAVARAALPKFETYDDGDTVDNATPQLPAPKTVRIPIPNNGNMAQETEDLDNLGNMDDDDDYDVDDFIDVTHVTPTTDASPSITADSVIAMIRDLCGEDFAAAGKHMVSMYAPGKQLKQMSPDQLAKLVERLQTMKRARELAREAFQEDWVDGYRTLVETADEKSGGADWKATDEALADVLEQLIEDAGQ